MAPGNARCVSVDGRTLVVTGFGFNTQTNRNEALVWTRPLPCAADLDDDGSFANGLSRDNAVDANDLLTFVVGFENGSSLVDLDDGTDTGTPDGAVDVSDLLFSSRGLRRGAD